MNVQIDLGNLAVGVATATIAVITAVVSMKNINESRRIADRQHRAEGARRLAEKRLLWIESLRAEIAEFMSLCSTMKDFGRINYLIGIIALRLDTKKQLHLELGAKLDDMANMARAVEKQRSKQKDGDKELASDAEKKFREAAHDLMDKARELLRAEWTQVKSELESKSITEMEQS